MVEGVACVAPVLTRLQTGGADRATGMGSGGWGGAWEVAPMGLGSGGAARVEGCGGGPSGGWGTRTGGVGRWGSLGSTG